MSYTTKSTSLYVLMLKWYKTTKRDRTHNILLYMIAQCIKNKNSIYKDIKKQYLRLNRTFIMVTT